MIESLADNLTIGSVEIDLISVSGPAFKDADNILLNLYLIAKDFSDAAIFDPEGQPCLPKDLLYKKDIMILRESDGITMNKQRLLADAKQKALELSLDYKSPAPVNMELPGASGEAALNLAVDGFYLKGAVTNYDVVVSNKVAKVLTGGDQAGPGMIVTQDYLRELERKNFMALVHDGRTLNRIVKTLPPNKGRKQYEAEERKAATPAPQVLRDDADRPGLFARVFGGSSAKKSFGQACAKNDNAGISRDPKAKVNWPRFGK